MLLSLLHETLRKVKTKEDLQKLLDMSDVTNIEARTATTVRATDTTIELKKLNSAGTLPFTLLDPDATFEKIYIQECNVKTLKGFFPKTLKTKKLILTKLNQLSTVDWLADFSANEIDITECDKLTSLSALPASLSDPMRTLKISSCPELSYHEHSGFKKLVIFGDAPKFSFKDFVNTKLELLSVSYALGQDGFHKLPYIVMIPKSCRVDIDVSSFELNGNSNNPRSPALKEIMEKAIAMQQRGGTKADLYQLQQDLINADLDNLADV